MTENSVSEDVQSFVKGLMYEEENDQYYFNSSVCEPRMFY